MSLPWIRTGIRTRYGERVGARCGARVVARLREDRGQAAFEFTGMVPIILGTLILLWQTALIGYALSLAGNAADEAARAGAVGASCQEAGQKYLTGAWSAAVDCGGDGELVTATVDVNIPILFPGFTIDAGVRGHASALRESGG
jgi:Flp pilus assembly protein TadG